MFTIIRLGGDHIKRNLTLLKLFALASSFTFSGGLAMLPMLHQKLVTKEKYLTSEEFYHYTALGQSLPGVTVVATACLLGEKVNRRSGRIYACIGAIAPVLVIMTILTMLYGIIPQTGVIVYVFTAIRATAGIFIIESSLEMSRYIIKGSNKAKLFVLVVISLLVVFKLSAVTLIFGCLLLAGLSIASGKDLL